MTKPTLSICIPSYRRAGMLMEVLQHLDQPDLMPFPYDVIVVDNGSPESEYEAVRAYAPSHYALSYQRNHRTLTAIENWMGTLRRAQGEFVMNLADDDRIDPAALTEAVLTMMLEPDIVATQCCWRELDLVSGELAAPALKFRSVAVGRDTAEPLIRSYLQSRFMPEISVYRTAALARALFPTELFFWPFILLDRLLRLGRVRVTDAPFYLAVVRRADEPYPRPTAGLNLPFATWDSMNRSFELLIHRYGRAAEPDKSAELEFERARGWFLDQAFIRHSTLGDYLLAFELACLLDARGTPSESLSESGRAGLFRGAGLQAMVAMLNFMPEIARIGLFGFPPDGAAQLTATLGRFGGLAVLPVGQGELGAPDLAVLSPDDERRRAALDAGCIEGKAFSLEGLEAIFRY